MPLEVYFVRHGESTNNILHEDLRAIHSNDYKHAHHLFIEQRRDDPTLTELGEKQVERVATRLQAELAQAVESRTVSVWTSYLSRALGTALAIQRGLLRGASASTTNNTTSSSPRRAAVPVYAMRDIAERGGSYRHCADRKVLHGTPGTSPVALQQQYPTFSLYAVPGVDRSSQIKKDAAEEWHPPVVEEDYEPVHGGVPPPPHHQGGDNASAAAVAGAEQALQQGWYTGTTKEVAEYGVERADRLLRRIDRTAAALITPTSPSATVVIVTHGDYFKTILKCLHASTKKTKPTAVATLRKVENDEPLVSWLSTSDIPGQSTDTWIPNTAVSHFTVECGSGEAAAVWTVRYLGDASHLSESTA